MEFLNLLYHTLRHLSPESVAQFAVYCGPWLLVVLFVILFCETGLVVMPFLPGDSLLFALGAVCATANSGVHLWEVGILLCLAANCGDLVNYTIGKAVGPKVFSQESSRLLNKKHLLEAHAFYEKHGRVAIILARFVPIIRTFAPFVAGIGKMDFFRFIFFSLAGGILWVWTCLLAGYALGSNPFVQKHFEVVVIAIIAISVLPVAFHALKSRGKARGETAEVAAKEPV